MKPLRRNVAIAVDGGGIRGIVVARALSILEDHLGRSVHSICRLAAGTSTGSVISAGIAARLTGAQMSALYAELAEVIFPQTLRSALWPLFRYRYPLDPLRKALEGVLGERTMADFWRADPPTDLVITAFDLVSNCTRFIKPWKVEYADWAAVRAVLCSCSVPTYFPPVAGRYVDGGVGSYTNPCYLAAYEAQYCLKWNPAETTLISLGTGRYPRGLRPGEANRLWPWEWLSPVLGAFSQSAADQQVHLVATLFPSLDFRRFQVDLDEPIGMDAVDKVDELLRYGDELGKKILEDDLDPAMDLRLQQLPHGI
jgi:predicted acylesterase/phospholipase RssA